MLQRYKLSCLLSKLFLFLLLPQINCGFNGLRLGNVKTSFAAALGWHHCCGKPNFFIMIDTTQLTQLISAFRVETEKESISPETVGSLLQNITDLLANASSTTEQQIFSPSLCVTSPTEDTQHAFSTSLLPHRYALV